MPFHGKITPDQWMAIAGALQNVGGLFGAPSQRGQGMPLMLHAIEQQSARRKEEAFRDLLKGFATPTARGPQYAGPPPAGPTNLVPPSSGGRVPVGSQLPGPSPQVQPGTPSQMYPGAPQPGIDPRLLSLIGAIGQEKGLPLLIQQMAKGPRERFEVVRDPYGRGGVGQRSTTTNRIVDYLRVRPESS